MQAFTTPKVMSKLLLALLLNVAVIQSAQALDPYQWEYWGLSAEKLAELRNVNPNIWYSITTSINNEMRRIANNQGNLLNFATTSTPAFNPTHVGYANFNYSCSDAATCNNKIASFQFQPNAVNQTLQIESNMNVYDISVSAVNLPINSLFEVRNDQSFAYQKTFSAFASNDTYLNICVSFNVNNINGNTTNALIMSGYDPNAGFPGFQSTFFGGGYWGKIASAAQLSALAQVAEYRLTGNSSLGGTVRMNINFTTASWTANFGEVDRRGTFPAQRLFNPFGANGTITGANLTGNYTPGSALGTGNPTVTGATVNATLVEIGTGTGVVGGVNVTTQGNNTIGDVFQITPVPSIQ